MVDIQPSPSGCFGTGLLDIPHLLLIILLKIKIYLNSWCIYPFIHALNPYEEENITQLLTREKAEMRQSSSHFINQCSNVQDYCKNRIVRNTCCGLTCCNDSPVQFCTQYNTNVHFHCFLNHKPYCCLSCLKKIGGM